MVTEDDIDLLLSSLEDKLAGAAEYKAFSARLIGTGFSIFRFIDYESNLSAILADLLDPSGSHGQGIVFLTHFLDLIERKLPSSSLGAQALHELCASKRILVRREQPTGRGRFVDIVVHGGEIAIGIENKPFARDLDDQLKDYATYLKHYSRWILLYVTGRAGGEPPANSLPGNMRQTLRNAGNYLELSYAQDLAEWTDSCIHACDADKVRWFLRDFRDFSMSKFKEGGESR